MSIQSEGGMDINSADTVRVAMRALQTAGVEPEPALTRAGAVVVDGVVRGGLARSAYCSLWARMGRVTGQGDFGLRFAGQVEAGLLGPLEWLATTARTMGEGLTALASCGRMLHTGGHYALERRAHDATFVYHPGSTLPSRELIDWAFRYLLRTARRATAATVAPRVVHVQYARPHDTASVEEAFGAPVVFGAPLNEIVFAREQLDAPLVTADPEVHSTLASLCRARCAGARSDRVEPRVRAALLRAIAREEVPSVAEVARQLGVSVRTLQRGLGHENLSFRQLVLEARMEMAQRWLADPTRAVADVAFALGYSEPSAFHRAYRSVYGRAYRADAAA